MVLFLFYVGTVRIVFYLEEIALCSGMPKNELLEVMNKFQIIKYHSSQETKMFSTVLHFSSVNTNTLHIYDVFYVYSCTLIKI